MPIPTVPLVIGGVVIAIGSGAAFKKWVYDPHLGPALEALAAEFLRGRGRSYQPIGVEVQQRELEEVAQPWAHSSAYELHPSSHIRRRSLAAQPSVDQVLFDMPASPRRRKVERQPQAVDLMSDDRDGPATPVASPRALAPQPMMQSPPLSADTTYTFLSLSQASSPAAPHAALESLDAWATQGLGLTPASPDPTVASFSTTFSAPASVNGSEAESWAFESAASESADDWERASMSSRV